MTTYAIDKQVAAIRREIAIRMSVYPMRIAAGKMKKEKADYEIEVMNAVLKTLTNISHSDEAEEPHPSRWVDRLE